MFENATTTLNPPANAEVANSLLDSERLECQASLQLLADRACWISGALAGAIALKEDGVINYCAVSGDSDLEPGTETAADPRGACLAERRPIRLEPSGEPPIFTIAVPVLRNSEAVGFIELRAEREFTDEVTDALSRLADLVAITLEHREAAERAGRLEFGSEGLDLPDKALWHAPEKPAAPEIAKQAAVRDTAKTPPEAIAPVAAPEIRTCVACGFPVSLGRALCVECEQKPGSASVPKPLFVAEVEESWLSAHGYTIASLVVTALTAALIVWLRR